MAPDPSAALAGALSNPFTVTLQPFYIFYVFLMIKHKKLEFFMFYYMNMDANI